MNLFDAITHSFATIATGGFSTKNTSIAYFDNSTIEIVIIFFMVLSGMHFATLFAVITGHVREFWKSSVIRYYLAALLIGIVITTLNVHGSNYPNWGDALRYAAFQVISIGTSTGFATTDSSVWPSLSHLIIIYFALQCACAGSTSGGIKVERMLLIGKSFMKYLKKLMHPNAVIPVHLDGRVIKEDILAKSILYIVLYLVIILLNTLILSALGVDNLSAFSGTVASIGNVGPGLGTLGSAANFNHLPELGKWSLSVTMLMGRLEIYAFFMFFTRAQWRKTISY
jgi:trk system potassium uptake protein TrkH